MAFFFNRSGVGFSGQRVLAWCFLLCTLPTCLGLALLTPINMFTDEPVHIARADGLRYGEILGVPQPGAAPGAPRRAGVMITAGMFNVLNIPETIDARPDRPARPAALRQIEAVRWDPAPAYFPTQMVEYFPILYAPAALGLLAGEKTGLSPLHTVYLGRIFILLAYVGMGTAAVALARRGAALLFAVLTLPAALNLGSSYNQDGMMIAACGLAAALLTRGPGRGWWGALALLIAVVSAKTPYAALLLLCLPPLCGPGLWRRAGSVLLAAVLPGLWLLHTLHNGFIPYWRTLYHPGPLWPGAHDLWLNNISPQDNLAVLLAHPAQIFILPLFTLRVFWTPIWPLILGGMSLGNLLIPAWELPCLIFALGVAAIGGVLGGATRRGAAADGIWAALAIFGAFTGMELALYLTSTGVGFAYIEGVSARYFLPLMPFFILLLSGGWGTAMRALPGFCFALPAVAMAIINIHVLPAQISHVFHMPLPLLGP